MAENNLKNSNMHIALSKKVFKAHEVVTSSDGSIARMIFHADAFLFKIRQDFAVQVTVFHGSEISEKTSQNIYDIIVIG